MNERLGVVALFADKSDETDTLFKIDYYTASLLR